MSGIQDWSSTPADNDDAPPVGAPENHDRSATNDILREVMASQRADWEGTATGGGEWRNPVSAYTVSQVSGTEVSIIGVDATAFFPVNRKVWIDQGTDAYAFVASSSFGGGNTSVTLKDFDASGASSVTADIVTINFHCAVGGGNGIQSGAFEVQGGPVFKIPLALTAAAINTAITEAQSEGKIVLLDDAEYQIETEIVLKSGVSIWGRGMRGSTVLKQVYDGYVITSAGSLSDITLRDFQIDGDSATRSAGGGISLGAADQGILIENVLIVDVFQYGVLALSPASNKVGLTMRNVDVDIAGDDGFRITDPSNTRTRDSYSGLTVWRPGTLTTTSSGILVEGVAQLSNINVDLQSESTTYGIRLERPGVAGTPDGGNKCSLAGFRVEGSGSGQIGLWVGGPNNAISDGVVNLLGGTAIPITLDGRGTAPEDAVGNIASNCQFIGGQRCTVAGDAPSTEFHGCRFKDQTGNQLEISALDTLVKDCSFVTASGTNGILINGSADDVDITGCTFRDQSGDGVQIQSACDYAVVSSCTFRDIGGDGVQIDSGSTGTTIIGNQFHSIGGSSINDAGTNTVISRNAGAPNHTFTVLAADQTGIGTAEVGVTGFIGLVPPHGADGVRQYRVTTGIHTDTGGSAANITVRVRTGTDGLITDALYGSTTEVTAFTDTTQWSQWFIWKPAAGEKLTLTVQFDANADNKVFSGGEYDYNSQNDDTTMSPHLPRRGTFAEIELMELA